ncbi:MAG: aspartate-semialdehyde dehydrogenase [Gammaproteobacteria bacterium]|nr:aspartate-semialdehyde dehydrogenase [Gammaproteobacteria bacterium]
MTVEYSVAIVGATGVVGEVFLEVLAERQFPIKEIHALASENSVGETVVFAGKSIKVTLLDDFDFSTVDYAFFSAGSKVASLYAPKAADVGCIVIDNSSQFRYDPDIPLVIPEVNPGALENYRERNIIANPNCSTIQMLVALKPIYQEAGITRINVATYQAVSGAGSAAIAELAKQTAELLNGGDIEENVLPRQIAFNVVPQIDQFQENGYTREEMKMYWETQKIFNDPDIQVNATAVRVPAFYGHSEAINIETIQPLEINHAIQLLQDAQGIEVLEDRDYPTAVTHAASQDKVYVGRIRQDISHPNGINMWVVADNVRKGAALNAVQIAELLVQDSFYRH